MKDYPVGATWQAITNPPGFEGKFWLDKISPGVQIWRWEACHSDGSGRKFDWQPSKRGVRNECAAALYSLYSNGTPRKFEVKFKRLV
jgi:hypothetical protein